jgi:peptidyl-prolyl cis-trans isomerase C
LACTLIFVYKFNRVPRTRKENVLINFDVLPAAKAKNAVSCSGLFCGVLLLVATMGLTACNKEKGGGQSLARVNGEDITMLQVNEELAHANVPADQRQAAIKKVLESLIDRQVIVDQAKQEKIDRSPGVLQAIARAKAQIIEQTYLQKVLSKIEKPNEAEVSDYFHQHPDLFSKGKLFDLKSLLIARKDMNDKLRAEMASAKSLDQIAAWLDSNHVRYARGVALRRSIDMPPEMVAKLMSMHTGQIFVVNDGGNSMIVSIVDVKDSPVTFEDAAPIIAKYLTGKKVKEAVNTEVKHLRSLAKIEYLNASAPAAASGGNMPASPASAVPETKPAG